MSDDVGDVKAKVEAVETKLEAKIDAVETELEAKIDTVETKLETKFDAFETSVVKNDLKMIMNALNANRPQQSDTGAD